MLTSNNTSQERANALAKLVAHDEIRASVEANVYAEAKVEDVEQADLEAFNAEPAIVAIEQAPDNGIFPYDYATPQPIESVIDEPDEDENAEPASDSLDSDVGTDPQAVPYVKE